MQVGRQLGRDHAVRYAVELAEACHCDQQREQRQFRCHSKFTYHAELVMSFGVDRMMMMRHDTKSMAAVSASKPSPIAGLIAPALLLFLLFFVLPFVLMPAISFFSSNPLT